MAGMRLATAFRGMNVTTAFPLIEIEGDPRQRGIQYGRQTGDRIAAGLRLYREEFTRRGTIWARAFEFASQLSPSIERYGADLMDEIRGIAEGSQQPVEAIVLLNARTEIIYRSIADDEANSPEAASAELMEECTAALAMPEATEDEHLLHGQNWDWRPDCVDTAVVVKIHSVDGPDILTFTEAGQLARHGMNSAGISITANGLHCDQDADHIGIPTPIIRRRMLMANSLAGAIGTILNSARSGSHHITIGHAGGEAAGLEATPEQVFWLRPENGIMTHANHFKSPAAMAKVNDLGLNICPESLYRDSRVEQHLRAAANRITVQSFKDAFADDYGSPDAVCRRPSARKSGSLSATVATLIMESAHRRMWIAPKPWESAHYTEYRL